MFFLPRNLVNIGLAITILGILAMAQTVVIVSGGLDISVGSIVGLATMVRRASPCRRPAAPRSASARRSGRRRWPGSVNGLIITYGRVNAVIATLGTMAAFRGFAFLTSGGSSVSIVERALPRARQRHAAGPAGADLGPARRRRVFAVVLSATVVGRNIYAIGGNPTVARLAGIPIRRYQIGIYIMSGRRRRPRRRSCWPRAPCPASRPRAARAWSWRRSPRPSWAAVRLQGGKGTIVGALLGVLIIGVLNNGLILTSVPTFYQLIAKGALLIVAVMIQEQQLRRAGEA